MSLVAQVNVTVCTFCREQYATIFPKTNQGNNCASTVSDSGIVGHYGSTLIDMQRWVWVDKIPEHISEHIENKNNVICDDCVRKLIKDKRIALVSEDWI